MTTTNAVSSKIDLEKFRLRTFVDRLIDMGEVEIHDEPVPLTGLGAIIERTEKAVLFKSAGPEKAEMVAKTAASRKRLIAAFETTEEKIYDEYFKRLANPKPVVEIPSGDAPVHAVQITGKDVDLTKLPFYPHHAYDGSCYMSSATDYVIDPATGRRNVGCRRLSLRNRYETGTNVTAPSDLKRIYTAERGARREAADHVHRRHPSARFRRRDHAPSRRRAGAGRDDARRARGGRQKPHQRHPGAGRRRDDARGLSRRARLCRAGRPVRRIHGLLRLDPHGPGVSLHRHHHADATCCITPCSTARRSILDQTDSQNISAIRVEAEAMRILKAAGRDPVAVYIAAHIGRLEHAARLDPAAQLRRSAARHRGAVRRHRAAQARLRLRRGHRHPQRPAGRMGARHALPGRPGPR